MTHVITRDTNYFLKRPQQGHRPDGTFAEGTKVKMLMKRNAYSKIESEDGIVAWVKTSDLEPIKDT